MGARTHTHTHTHKIRNVLLILEVILELAALPLERGEKQKTD